MTRFRHKPEVIEAIEIISDDLPSYMPILLRRARTTPLEVWNALHKSWIGCKFGDWLRIDNPDDVYPIDAATFARTYEPVEEGRAMPYDVVAAFETWYVCTDRRAVWAALAADDDRRAAWLAFQAGWEAAHDHQDAED